MTTKLRKAKENASFVVYADDIEIAENYQNKWDLKEKLSSDRYSDKIIKRFQNGDSFDLKYLNEDSFKTPIMFEEKEGLNLRLPSDDFTVDDVAAAVGKERVLDVVDVNTQDAIGMKMKDWCKYYKNPEKSQLLNVISLEFSQTKLDKIIQPPEIISLLDWVMLYWPNKEFLNGKDNQSNMSTMTYPKVRKYCLMSVAGCYTDFHIDLGGTSVWYHILKGEKVFFMIPPSPENLKMFEAWCNNSTKQSTEFLGDLVSQCERVHLPQGSTFMIPSGWIHAVYTPIDSLVFGGNFLHTFSTEMQLQVYRIEEKIRVPNKYRYPFFIIIHWYVLAGLVSRVTGKVYIRNSDINCDSHNKFLKPYEEQSIHTIVKWLKTNSLQHNKGIPADLIDPQLLMSDAENLDKLKALSKPPEYGSIFDKCQQIMYEVKPKIPPLKLKVIKKPTNEIENISELSNQNHTNSRNIFESMYAFTKSEEEVIKNDTISLNNDKTPPHSPNRKHRKVTNQKSPEIKTAEIPTQMFEQIVSRRNEKESRKICRPDRFVEHKQ